MDLIADLGPIALGSRLKRLAERLQADAAQILADADLPVQPVHVTVLAALENGPVSTAAITAQLGVSQPGVTRSIGSLKAAGLAISAPDPHDRRSALVSLSPEGARVLAGIKTRVWPRLGQTVEDMCGGNAEALLDLVLRVERALAERSMAQRFAEDLTILPWSPDRAQAFHDINAQWISAMFTLEATDRRVLMDPQGQIIDKGGNILFVEARGLGVVGACALMPHGDGGVELTKMGVLDAARGRKAGDALLVAILDEARALGLENLFLLTNTACAAAIHLYEKHGFTHDADIMARYGGGYSRCNVAMRWTPQGQDL